MRLAKLLLSLTVMGGSGFAARRHFQNQALDGVNVPGGGSYNPLDSFSELDAIGGGQVDQGALNKLKALIGMGGNDSSADTYTTRGTYPESKPPADVRDNPFFAE